MNSEMDRLYWMFRPPWYYEREHVTKTLQDWGGNMMAPWPDSFKFHQKIYYVLKILSIIHVNCHYLSYLLIVLVTSYVPYFCNQMARDVQHWPQLAGFRITMAIVWFGGDSTQVTTGGRGIMWHMWPQMTFIQGWFQSNLILSWLLICNWGCITPPMSFNHCQKHVKEGQHFFFLELHVKNK